MQKASLRTRATAAGARPRLDLFDLFQSSSLDLPAVDAAAGEGSPRLDPTTVDAVAEAARPRARLDLFDLFRNLQLQPSAPDP